MSTISFDDRLEILGLLAGGFVTLAALGTLAGQPWATAEGTGVAVAQVVGVLLTLAVGVLIVFVTQGYDLGDIR